MDRKLLINKLHFLAEDMGYRRDNGSGEPDSHEWWDDQAQTARSAIAALSGASLKAAVEEIEAVMAHNTKFDYHPRAGGLREALSILRKHGLVPGEK